MENKKLLAAENHKNGNSCSQAVNLAFCDVTGLSAEAAKEEAARTLQQRCESGMRCLHGSTAGTGSCSTR